MNKITTHKKQSKILKKKKKDKARAKRSKKAKDQNKLIEKEMQNRLDAVQNILSKIPENCTSCGDKFDNSNSIHLDTWKFSYHEEGISLSCGNCIEEENV